jgi:hypothetical protein
MLITNELALRIAKQTQIDLHSENEFRHRPKHAVNYDLGLYKCCQELINHAEAGGNASKYLSQKIGEEIDSYNAWLKNASDDDILNRAPGMPWTNIGLSFAAEIEAN